ncbi:SDR family oxidoreductase [Lutimaribacter sp. EGI FJ00015]|uniref:SDR family oxidoreductase n=1 Tax=Lutimaribacter degradans TaxID=2945989 RepID=A0ACC5ZWZ1_9RHOB|nr:SDR family oxidoreductase [Lutimaribacter sp. EGI FJ00013]MCM2562837.1 SDR family oxidoreductase [Lutimaribacter sp. EGI FJ00013]MCO0613994.1 SDR family oxidoreductase [Lutimaribacter sp. EGI FJ00015]MCO0636966.1 SDR family oxidoreductase [Lutimaribacter sp. EGI FJ00014]
MEKTLLSFGHGYVAQTLAPLLLTRGWTIYGTTRNPNKVKDLQDQGVRPLLWGQDDIAAIIAGATHIMSSVAPAEGKDPVLAEFRQDIAQAAPRLHWAGYLSTTGVYGDHQGGWVDETTPLAPGTARGKARVAAERGWADIPGLPLHVFRLPGIYGPGRSAFDRLRAGNARRIIKPGQVFSRIHVDDIAQVLAASMAAPDPGAIYNVCDDEPAPSQDVIAHAAELLDLPLPPAVDFDTANLSPMARSFYSESKRMRNDRIKTKLGITLHHPTYREGLAAILASDRA